jgi:DNA primase large subunit
MADLERACAQVGRFLYHFAHLENQIDAALAKLFELDTNSANTITASVDFFKRFNFVLTATLQQISEKKERDRVRKILKKVAAHNNERQVVAHSRFEPEGDGVRFRRVVAREGTVRVPDERWSKQDFENKYEGMKKLTQQLQEVVAEVKPAKGYVLPADTGTYTTHFASAFLGSPRALLDDKD